MTEKKSPDEVLAILRTAAKKDAVASYDAGFQAGARGSEEQQARASKEQLKQQFNERLASLNASRRKSPTKLREIQNEFMEAGLAWEDVDETHYGTARDERHNDLHSASYRRVIGPRSR